MVSVCALSCRAVVRAGRVEPSPKTGVAIAVVALHWGLAVVKHWWGLVGFTRGPNRAPCGPEPESRTNLAPMRGNMRRAFPRVPQRGIEEVAQAPAQAAARVSARNRDRPPPYPYPLEQTWCCSCLCRCDLCLRCPFPIHDVRMGFPVRLRGTYGGGSEKEEHVRL